MPRYFVIPHQVDKHDLNKNRMLLSDEQIAAIRDLIKGGDIHIGRNKKSALRDYAQPDDPAMQCLAKLKYSIIHTENGTYALYLGKEHNNGEHILGAGGFGKVKLAQNIDTGEWVAVKIIKRDDKLENSLHEAITTEEKLLILSKLYIASYPRTKKDSKTSCYEMLLKIAPGKPLHKIGYDYFDDLVKLVTNNPAFAKEIARRKISPATATGRILSILEKIHALHTLGYVHRDLSVTNIFYDPIEQVTTLIDFGLSSKKDEPTLFEHGNPDYMAPEAADAVFYGKTMPCTTALDTYSAGITLAEMLGLVTCKDKNHHQGYLCIVPPSNRVNIMTTADDVRSYRMHRTTCAIYDEKHAEKSNDAIDRILEILHAMTDPSPEERCSLEEAIQQFKILHDYFIEQSNKLSPATTSSLAQLGTFGSRSNLKRERTELNETIDLQLDGMHFKRQKL